ncbi:PAC2 family protein [Halostella sp. PRR32]|uniref:proteasome assembly chaperone family protein n=1 Tax=Halostella sp. PRR32 TaxID=3098147 RepID=UPI002B1CF339|nr:PAC2 family protein [Halostella sp. PRR32]
MPTEPSFEVIPSTDVQPGERLLFGVSHLGMAGVTAAAYLVRNMDFETLGYVDTHGFPAIAPFEAGEPRHPLRLYTSEQSGFTVFVGESFIPVGAAEAFVDGFLEWIRESSVEEVVVLYGVPYPHAPEQHRVFYTATPEFRESTLTDAAIDPLAGGFLDGIVAEFVLRSLKGEAPPTGVFITPSHPPGPDLDAALLLLQAVEEIYDFDIDEKDLEAQAEELKQFFSELASRMDAQAQGERSLSAREYPEDSMYM